MPRDNQKEQKRWKTEHQCRRTNGRSVLSGCSSAVEETEEGSMEGVNFAVLALGDTAFELFCESGKEWDTILEEKGGNRVNDRIDCDTDYDDYAEEWLEATLGLMKEIS